jgi:hypothetical protein
MRNPVWNAVLSPEAVRRKVLPTDSRCNSQADFAFDHHLRLLISADNNRRQTADAL